MVHMTTVVKDVGKCTVCGKHKDPAEMVNPLAQKFGICDQCFMHRQRDWEDRNPDTERENLKFKAECSGVGCKAEGKIPLTVSLDTGDVGKIKVCPECHKKILEHDAIRRHMEANDPHKLSESQRDEMKAVMAVSSPEQGKTCNCNQGDHSNANGDQHGMYNQEGGRANWQGQGLPQPSKTCECDEKPAEADKVPNADARISDKEMKEDKKKFLNYSDEEIVEVDGKTTKRKKKKIKKMTPAQLEARKKKKPYRHSDLRRRKYREKKTLYISDLDDEGKPRTLGRNAALVHGQKVGHKRRKQIKERKIREGMEALDKKIKALANIIKRNKKHKPELFIGDLDEEGKVTDATRQYNIRQVKRRRRKLPPRTVHEHDSKRHKYRVRTGMEGLDKKLKALEDILKKRKTRRGGRRGATRGHFSGKWRKTLTPQQTKETTTPKDNAATAENRAIAAKLGFLKQTPEKKILPKELGKPSQTATPTGKKQFRKPKPKKRGNLTGAQTKEQGLADAANTKRQKLEAEKKRKEPTKKKTPPKKRTGTKVREGMSMFDKALFLAKHRGKKKLTAGEKEKKRLEANLSPEVEANMKRVEDLKDNVDALGRDKRTQHSSEGLKLITPQRKKLQRELLANEKKQKKTKKKKKVKPKKSKFPQFGIKAHGKKFDWESFFRKYGIKPPEKKEKAEDTPYYDLLSDKPKKKKKPTKVLYRDLFEKAEENQFGAWGHRGLGDGSGTGAIQGAGDTHLITPQRKKLQRELLANEKKQKKTKKKKKVKHKKSKFPKFGITKRSHGKKFDWESFFRKYGIKPPEKKEKAEDTPYYDLLSDKPKKKKKPTKVLYRDLFEKAEENQFGAWGQRGLGDGNGTGAIQGAGDTHLISPIKQKELDKLMAGARYMPRSVPRRKK